MLKEVAYMITNRVQLLNVLHTIIMLAILAGLVLFPVAYTIQAIYAQVPPWTETVPQPVTLALAKIFALTLAVYIWQYHARRDFVEVHVRHMREGYRLVGFTMMCITAAGALAVVSILAAHAGLAVLSSIVYPLLVLTISVCGPLYARTVRLDGTLSSITLASVQPVKRILYHDRRMILMLIGMLLSALLLVGAAGVPLVRAMNITSTPPPAAVAVTSVPPPTDFFDEGYAPEAIQTIFYTDGLTLEIPRTIRNHAERIAQIVTMFFAVVGVMLLFIVLPAVIIMAIYWFIRLRREGRGKRLPKILSEREPMPVFNDHQDGDEREFILPFLKKRRRRSMIPLNPIRRAFRDKIMEYIKHGAPIHVSDTPAEMIRRIETEDLTQLAAQYCEVRYSHSQEGNQL